jgi:hypothetical protein
MGWGLANTFRGKVDMIACLGMTTVWRVEMGFCWIPTLSLRNSGKSTLSILLLSQEFQLLSVTTMPMGKWLVGC